MRQGVGVGTIHDFAEGVDTRKKSQEGLVRGDVQKLY
jgi:hypothetical protein